MTLIQRVCLSVCLLFFSTRLQAQFGDENYAYLGLALQTGKISNAYTIGGNTYNDRFLGPGVLFGVETYNEGGSWNNFVADGLLLAVVSIKKPTFAPKLSQYESRSQGQAITSLYYFSTPLLKWSAGFPVGKQDLVGPTVQFGLEGLSLLGIKPNGKGGKPNMSMGATYDGFVTYGTGLLVSNPLRKFSLFRNSRFTFNIDWMLGREPDAVFRVSGRKRFSFELAAMLGRRGYVKMFYQYIHYAKAYEVGIQPAVTVNAKVAVFGLGIGLNWLQY